MTYPSITGYNVPERVSEIQCTLSILARSIATIIDLQKEINMRICCIESALVKKAKKRKK